MSRARFPRRWSMVQMRDDLPGWQGHARAVELSGHWTVRAALAARDRRRRTSAGARFRVVPSRWAPRRRIRAWVALELAFRGPQTTRQVKAAGVLPLAVVQAALADLARSGAITYEVPGEAGAIADALVEAGLISAASEIGRWRLLWNPAHVAAAAAVPGGGWTWASERTPQEWIPG